MSKKPPKAKKQAKRAELIEARVIREEDWALEAWRSRVGFAEMRRLAGLTVADGGLGYTLSESALRGLVQSAKARHGETRMTREERIDRQQEELDDRARRARFDLAKWHAIANRPEPERDNFSDRSDYLDAMTAWAKGVEAASKMITDADRRLREAQKDEREIHGDNAATKVEAEITTRDGVLDELNASLAALGLDTVEKVDS